jgi:hypothetical protein
MRLIKDLKSLLTLTEAKGVQPVSTTLAPLAFITNKTIFLYLKNKFFKQENYVLYYNKLYIVAFAMP